MQFPTIDVAESNFVETMVTQWWFSSNCSSPLSFLFLGTRQALDGLFEILHLQIEVLQFGCQLHQLAVQLLRVFFVHVEEVRHPLKEAGVHHVGNARQLAVLENYRCVKGKRKRNKYRWGTKDATTSSSLIISLLMMSLDDIIPSKMAIFVFRK